MSKLVPVPFYPKSYGDPDFCSTVTMHKAKWHGRRRHHRVVENFFRKLRGLPPKRSVLVKCEFSFFEKPEVNFRIGKQDYTLTCKNTASAERARDKIVEWANKGKTDATCKYSEING